MHTRFAAPLLLLSLLGGCSGGDWGATHLEYCNFLGSQNKQLAGTVADLREMVNEAGEKTGEPRAQLCLDVDARLETLHGELIGIEHTTAIVQSGSPTRSASPTIIRGTLGRAVDQRSDRILEGCRRGDVARADDQLTELEGYVAQMFLAALLECKTDGWKDPNGFLQE